MFHFYSIKAVNGKLKKFNNTLYAVVKLTLEDDISDFLSKPSFLNKANKLLNNLTNPFADIPVTALKSYIIRYRDS